MCVLVVVVMIGFVITVGMECDENVKVERERLQATEIRSTKQNDAALSLWLKIGGL